MRIKILKTQKEKRTPRRAAMAVAVIGIAATLLGYNLIQSNVTVA